jgi:hypothetical protein
MVSIACPKSGLGEGEGEDRKERGEKGRREKGQREWKKKGKNSREI